MSTDTPLTLALARTRPVTYYMTNDSRPGCLDAVVFQHWTEPIDILVSRPDSAPFITFAKYVDGQLAIRVTTPIQQTGTRVHVPDVVLCWATLDRFTAPDAGPEPGHLIVRNGKIFSQRLKRGSDAGVQRKRGSDASSMEAGAPLATSSRASARTGSSPAPATCTGSTSSSPAPATLPRWLAWLVAYASRRRRAR